MNKDDVADWLQAATCEHCISTGFSHPCKCCEHCRSHGYWLGADCSCENEQDFQFTALEDEVRLWRKVMLRLCGLFQSQGENTAQNPGLAMIRESGVSDEGAQNKVDLIHLLDTNRGGGLPNSIRWAECEPCEEIMPSIRVQVCNDFPRSTTLARLNMFALDWECLVCGQSVKKEEEE